MARASAVVVGLLLTVGSLHTAHGAMSPFLSSFSSKLLAPGVSPLGASPFAMPVKDPACGDLPLGQCQLRTAKCKDIKSLAQGASGPVKDVMDCGTLLGIPKMLIIGVLPQAFGEGKPETIVDRVMPNNTEASSELRRCVMQASGLDVVATVLTTCPDPESIRKPPVTVPSNSKNGRDSTGSDKLTVISEVGPDKSRIKTEISTKHPNRVQIYTVKTDKCGIVLSAVAKLLMIQHPQNILLK
ncbi:uncharacterized protein LOC122246032 [Penaeus japonicus]|uniref:uncharacterized protein LOC122246032 n=1 Tax=Penaeus japonicus TaxID=27405 RepID=UPI001C716316|nr:uncharacterized protein LOC122246032 [Penaeus japonicus]